MLEKDREDYPTRANMPVEDDEIAVESSP